MIEAILGLTPIWFAGTLLGLGFLKYISRNSSSGVAPEATVTSKKFSMWSIFLSIQGGKAVIFFAFLFTMTSFLLFSIVTARGIATKILG